MVQLNVDITEHPGGQLSIALQIAGVSRGRTKDELLTAEDLYAKIAIVTLDLAKRSGGRIAFSYGPN